MNDLRIVFLGTPDFAVATLKALVKHKKNIVGVITAPDKPAGRGRTLHQSAVKQYALSQNLHVLQPTNLKAEDFLAQLNSLQANLQIVVAFRMLPKEVWQMPKFGTFNLHASLLPQYRGAAPINWVIINGESKTGVSTFFIDEKIDTGHIILQEETTIEKNENAGSLHDKLMLLGSQLVLKTVSLIEDGTVHTIEQNFTEEVKTAYKLDTENTKINWNCSVETIHNKVRGLSPYPSAWSYIQNGESEISIKIFATEIKIEKHNEEIGKVISTKNTLKVAAKNGWVFLQELQLPGKKKMNIKSLLNGYNFESNAKMR
ncbi:MAG: methionyl-tRNA formyltransferase [Flavobacteriaceae bacterium CG2_30_34_30]|nr:MAG: methionyl-tRNA formyltransferase [Flavobacteriaceae bacterium CG2_30_34_30]PIQ18636.1 MAG: methionyl-tRNA formyltransferase [Flavobacteriaceae bacterium CG18_big_fil_WC_8_21_14_2_50_34_36]PJC07585.1 MAG: methionyl-tRNA formyltransferase [Flavobacteriaceae bacterium CG_4_9_14_0_8_um_filter_34_30]